MSIYVIVALVTVSMVLVYVNNNRWASPVVSIVNRWLRWVIIALSAAWVATEFFGSERPFWILTASAFLGWFLLETMFNWMAIKALSQSPMPLFPRFVESDEASAWPLQRRIFRIRDWLRLCGYEQIQALSSDIGIGVLLRSFVFQSSDKKTRLQLLFLPQKSGNPIECFSFQSVAEDGIRLVTDNLFIPFGGFYPENWRVVRRTWVRRVSRLARLHEDRMKKHPGEFEEWEGNALEDINYQQAILEKTNMEHGFLFPYHLREEYGKITSEGRYRVWKEIWFLNYFGRSTASSPRADA